MLRLFMSTMVSCQCWLLLVVLVELLVVLVILSTPGSMLALEYAAPALCHYITPTV